MNFTVETSDIADSEIESAYLRFSSQDPEFAGRWLEGIYRVLATLSVFPLRHARVAESDIVGREVRRMLYRNGRSVYRILFTLIDADSDGEADTVRVLRVRHGARQSLGRMNAEDEE